MNQSEPVIIIATRLSMGNSGELVYLLHNLIETLHHQQPPRSPNDAWPHAGPGHAEPEDHCDTPF